MDPNKKIAEELDTRSMSFGFTYEYSDDMLCVVSDETNSTFDCKVKGNKMFWQINGQAIVFDRIT